MKIAVTTASGNLGSAIIRQLKKDIGANQIIGIARSPHKAEHHGIEIRKGDYNHKSDFEKALRGVDAVLMVSNMDKPENRVSQHRNIIDAAKQCNVKKIVYTSITGDPDRTAFSAVVRSNRQSEEDIKTSGLQWSIGRNGLYVEPDLEYLDGYVKEGEIANSAGEGKCAYTSRKELAIAFSEMLRKEKHNGKTYTLVGQPITQQELVEHINHEFNLNLTYREIPVQQFMENRKQELGELLGTIVGGIYESIKLGAFDVPSDFNAATGRGHKSVSEMIKDFKRINR